MEKIYQCVFFKGRKASTCTLVTPSPTDSTTAAASWPRTQGKSPCKNSHPDQKKVVSPPPDRGRRGSRCRCDRARCWSLSLAPRQPWVEPPEDTFGSDRSFLVITRSWLGVNLSFTLSLFLSLSFSLPLSLSQVTWISVTSRGFLASQATAALHVIVWPWVAWSWKLATISFYKKFAWSWELAIISFYK